MTAFNPHDPCAVGLEWFVDTQALQAVSSDVADTHTAEVKVASTATETVDALWFFSARAPKGKYEISIFEYDSFAAAVTGSGSITTNTHRPGADHYGVNAFGWSQSGGLEAYGSLYARINEATFTPGTYNVGTPEPRNVQDNSWISPIYGKGCEYACKFTGLSGAYANKQIVDVTVKARADLLVAYSLVNSGTLTPFLSIGGVRYLGPSYTLAGEQTGGYAIDHTWYANPATGCAWTPDDVELFDSSGGSYAAGWIIGPTGSANNLVVLYQGWLEVRTVAENRVATGCLQLAGAGWNRAELRTPAGSLGWSKTAGTDYVISLRSRKSSPGNDVMLPVLMDSRQVCPSQITGLSVQFSPYTKLLDSIRAESRVTPAMVLEVASAASVDSQPYTWAGDEYIEGVRTGADDTTRVYVGHALRQHLTVPAGDFAFIRALIACDAGVPSEPLYADLYTTPGDVLVTTVTIDPSDIRGAPTKWRVIEKTFGPETIASGAYYLQFRSDAAQGAGWRVQCLSTLDVGVARSPFLGFFADTSMGGMTDRAEAYDGTSYPYQRMDLCATIHQVVEPPGSFSVVTTPITGTPSIEYAQLSWASEPATGCGSQFIQYEIERTEDGGTTWAPIAVLDQLATTSFADYELVRNAAVQYRIRVRRADQACSFWVTSDPVTAAMPVDGFLFTSNQAPEWTCWYEDLEDRKIKFQENVSLVQLAGRDFQTGFRELEARGDSFDLRLLVAADRMAALCGTSEATTDGSAVFVPMRVLVGNMRDPATGEKVTTAYTAAITREDRWFGLVQLGSGTRKEPAGRYYIDASFTQTTDVPAIATEA